MLILVFDPVGFVIHVSGSHAPSADVHRLRGQLQIWGQTR